MAGRKELTDIAVRNAKPPQSGQRELFDGKLPGFCLRISKGGTKSFCIYYRVAGRRKRFTLGRYPQITLSGARKKAHKVLSDVALGGDPQAEKKIVKNNHTFDKAVEEFKVSHCERYNKAATATETIRLLRYEFSPKWSNTDVRDIGKSDVLAILDKIVKRGSPSGANHAFAAIRKFFSWCVERSLVDVSPCIGIKSPAKHNSRDRVLEDFELAAIWQAACQIGYPYGSIVQLLALTGQRRGEITFMSWHHFNMEKKIWSLSSEMTKAGRAHEVPLAPMALNVILTLPRLHEALLFPARGRTNSVYSGFSKNKKRIDKLSGVSDWTLHDIRRTVATGMAQLRIEPHVVEKLLNHSSGTFGGVAGVYNRFGYLPEMREALEKWEGHIGALLMETESVHR